MLYLVTPHTEQIRAQITAGRLGAFRTPRNRNVIEPGWVWAADNGAFTGFDAARFRLMLARHHAVAASCLFVACPDVVGDWPATLALWNEWHAQLDGYPPAVVCQDGATPASIPWADAAAVFIGGSTAWKLSEQAAAIVAEANRRNTWAHMGRVNSRRRLGAATSMGCDSADGTFLAFAPDTNLARLDHWLDLEHAAPRLDLPAH